MHPVSSRASNADGPGGAFSAVEQFTRRPAEDRSAARAGSHNTAFDDSLPFLFFGAVCVLTAIWLRISNPVPGNPLPLWILLIGVGIIALAGGIVGILIAEPVAPKRSTGRSRRVAPVAEVEELPPPVPAEIAPRAAVAPAPARAGVSAREMVSLEAEASDFMGLGGRSSVRPSTFARPRSVLNDDDEISVEEPRATPADSDDVLQSIEELSDLIRRDRRGGTAPAPAPAPPVACGSCGNPVAAGPDPARCHSCHTPLCAACVELGQRDGHPGICATCALLEAAESSDRTPGGWRSRADESSTP